MKQYHYKKVIGFTEQQLKPTSGLTALIFFLKTKMKKKKLELITLTSPAAEQQ